MEVIDLIRCGIQPTQARAFAPFMDATFNQFGIFTIQHKAAFIAQARHESTNFTHLEESTYYSTPQIMRNAFRRLRLLPDSALLPYCRKGKEFANFVYAKQNGNGDEASGDGFRYRGRGLPQLTGRVNYAAAGTGCEQPYLTVPSMLTDPEHAVKVFGWFWMSKRLGPKMDAEGINAVSIAINGGTNGLSVRADLFDQVYHALTS